MNIGINQMMQTNEANTNVQLSAEQQQAMLRIQHSILESVVKGDSQQTLLDRLCKMAEELVPDSIATVMLMEGRDVLDVISAPSVDEKGQKLLCGLKPGPTAGTCGNAVYKNEATFVSNVHNDARCEMICDLFEQFELNACWSNPIRSQDGKAIGSFALSSFESRAPSSFHKELLAVGSYVIGIILERSKQQSKLEKLAFEDTLTGLGNRSKLLQYLEQTIAKSARNKHSFSLIYLDLRRFKALNDCFGHKFGDEVLKLVASRLDSTVGSDAFLARPSGDQFVIVLDVNTQTETVTQVIEEAFEHKFPLKSYSLKLDCCMGIASFPNDGDDVESLMANAETAMYRAKDLSAKACHYDSNLISRSKQAFTIETKMRQALVDDSFTLNLQAKVNANDSQVSGYEVLLRWHDDELGHLSPADFIPLAETTGLIIPIGEWVVKNALAQAEQLALQSAWSFNLAINLSGVQLTEPHINTLIELVNASSFPNEQVFFEITETVLVEEASLASQLLERIRQANIKLSIDDFGIGYSSLAYLKRFNVSQLKMDKLLIDEVDSNEESYSIVKAVIALGHSLGLEVVAEGVETLSQSRVLNKLGCDTLQGFYFSRPAPLKEYLK